jgi:hypothetical protein
MTKQKQQSRHGEFDPHDQHRLVLNMGPECEEFTSHPRKAQCDRGTREKDQHMGAQRNHMVAHGVFFATWLLQQSLPFIASVSCVMYRTSDPVLSRSACLTTTGTDQSFKETTKQASVSSSEERLRKASNMCIIVRLNVINRSVSVRGFRLQETSSNHAVEMHSP